MLYCAPCDPEPFNVAAISRLTGLTQLTLWGIVCSSGFRALCSLPLQDLRVHDCPGAEFLLFVPGAFSALRELRYTEAAGLIVEFAKKLCSIEDSSPEEGQLLQNTVRRLQEVGDTLLSLPSLVEVSGSCRLLMFGIKDGQNGWRRQIPLEYGSQGCGSVQECFCNQCCARRQLWTRAHKA